MKNRDIKKLFKWKIWKKGTACLLVFSVLLQTVTVSAQGIAKGPPIDMQLIQQLQEAKMPMQSDVSEEGQIVQSSGEQSELTENGQTDQPSGNQSGSMENGQTGQPSGDQSGSMENGQTDQPSGDQSGSAENGQAVQPSGDQSGSAENGQTDPSSDQQSEDADLYENGIIKIYNIEQLQAIGTGSSVRMNDTEKKLFGTGEEVVDGGNAVTYASDADYMLMNEIPLTAKTMWTLPEGFTGTFAEAPKEDAPLYDKESDTVYVYNNYQLLLIASENSAEEPIMSYDMIPEKVGIGQLLYKDGTLADESAEAAQEYLTYSKEHNYVLSPSFTEQMPELKAEKIKKEATVQADAGQLGGREYLGQVYTKVEGEPYILIGNEWQLRAIGQDAKPKEKGNQYMQVTPMLYVKSIVDLPWPWDDKITYTPYYPGDADFNLKQGEALGESGIEQKDFIYFSEANTNKTEGLMNIEYDKEGLVGFLLGPLGELLGDILHALLGPLFDIPILGDLLAGLIGERTDDIVIVDKEFNQNNVQSYPSLSEASNELKSLKYSPDANYIIFRDIDLLQGEYSDGKEDDWTPLHFSGKMEGRLNMQEGSVPTISNIQVNQTGELDIQKDSGIGFFGTISNEMKKSGNGGFESAGKAGVKNLHLDQVTVNNQSVTVNNDPKSLVEGLLEVLGGLLGGILDLISGILEGLVPVIGNLKLGDVIKDLLTLKQSSPDMFATGSFAGRIVGDVSVENCTVTNASVTNVKGMTGGFVGYTSGEATYILGNVTAGVVELLSTLLNILPGVGLGDLITILLKNDVPLGQLLPNGYYKPLIQNSSVSLSEGSIGTTGTGKETVNYNGGFVGSQTGTDINNCSVTGLNQVVADIGAGGFAGIEKDAQVKGLLSDLGAEIKTFDIRSTQRNCHVDASDLSVTATDSYAGGFNGVMANSSSIESNVSGVKLVKANQYAGGFAGRATLGYGMAVGSNDEQNDTLLQSVSKLLEQLLASGNEEELGVLLSLSGAQPSEIKGSSVSGTNFSVQAAADYAGGLIGQGDGVQITSSGTEKNTIQGVSFVKANNYAGGISGAVTVADAVGVLNDTLGIGSYLSFTVSNVDLGGNDLQIEASNKYASGGAGLMLGGTAEQIKIEGIQSVTAGNYAAGFAGRAGTGSLAKEGGLDLLGLGLIKVDSLLSLVDGVATKVSNVSVSGTENGAVIKASGQVEITEGESILAGGFISEAEGVQIADSHVTNLKAVYAEAAKDKEGYAGGFVGRSHTGGLAGLAQEDKDGALKLPGIVNVSGLLDLVPYLIPQYTNTTVTFCSANEEPQVKADYAGGFFGEMQSGKVDNSTRTEAYAVYGLEKVKGESHAGGFAGKVDAGATASSNGLNLLGGILNLDIGQLLDVLQVYIPIIQSAGVKSTEKGFTVEATDTDSYAGGYLGYGGGVQIKDSDVTSLKHTKVTPPGDSLESANGDSYFGTDSQYAVKGGKYAGGYAGCVDIDSAAAVGGGLKLLGNIELTNLLKALDVVASTIENSDVNGCVGGYSVLADGRDDKNQKLGKAGGFIGEMSGTIIKNSDANLFNYIIGREAAGGYAGIMEPGNVASVIEDAGILDGLLNVTDSLASLVQSFIPIIEDSQTSSVPCGGAVRADGITDTQCVRGLAGGYVGYNHGGRIKGYAAEGGGKECATIRIRSVYGGEFAGGFTGLMETADLAGTGNLQLLFGLLKTSNVLSLLGAVYPTETNTAVYGPLRKVDMDTWNKWAEAVGNNGVYGDQFTSTPVENEEQLQALITQYAYGYNVKAGRTSVGRQDMEAGVAGGYVGRMKAGVVTNAHAWDAKSVMAYKSAGGFAGEMKTGGVAEVGKVELIGLDIANSISAVQTFVPVIRNSDITGFQSGMTVKATGIPVKDSTLKIEKVGYAGGYVGHMVGGQIWGNWSEKANTYSATDAVPDPNNKRCFVANLRKVEGTKAIGGFAGQIDPASAANLDTASSEGLLGGLLQYLIGTPGDLARLLDATISTVRGADVKAWDDWGIIINGAYTNGTGNTAYAKAAGGFAGEINGAVIGEMNESESGVHVSNVRSVTGGEYAGGFVGLADVSAILQVSNGNTSILSALLTLGGTSVLDTFRSYVYHSDVSGSAEAGLEVQARDSKKSEYVNDPVYSGSAGGFGGALLNGSVKDSKVTNLRKVNGMNYTGRFIGHLGKSGTVDLDNLGALGDLLSAGAGVMDVFGSHVDRCSVEGVNEGFTVHSNNTIDQKNKSEIAGGFTGYADLGRLSENKVTGLKQVTSGQIAGGFAGKTTFAYLANINLDSELVKGLVTVVNQILKALWLDELQKGQVIKIDLGIIEIDALYDGKLVSLNLLGLDIKVGLAEDKSLATIYIGDSKIEINCSESGTIDEESLKNEINISLIKANRTKIDKCTVTGIADGYDVYGGGAGNNANGTGQYGIAGGFVGWNNEGLLENNNMFFADVIRGAKDLTGPFTGKSSLNSNWEFNDVKGIEGNENYYRIYRNGDTAYEKLFGKSGKELQHNYETSDAWKNVYTIRHMTKDKVVKFTDLKDAMMSGSAGQIPVNVYQEDGAMAVLMNNTASSPTEPGGNEEAPDVQDPCKDLIELRLKKVWKRDEEKDRPNEVIFNITRSYEKDGKPVVDTNFNKEVILTKKDAQTSDIWEKVLTGAEYTAYHVGTDGKKYYYTYHVSEMKVDGYTTEITYKGDRQYSITVTNTKNWFDSLLPETGGMGKALLYALGVLLLCLVTATEYRKRKSTRSQSSYK